MNKTVVLEIDTTDSQKTRVAVVTGNKRHELIEETNSKTKSQNVLPMIEKILHQQKINSSAIKEIKVNPGPGSFTGTRVGIAVANTLGWVLGVPVNGQKIALPVYEASKFDE